MVANRIKNLPPNNERQQGPRDREKTASALKLALRRLQKRSAKITIAAVAKEAGVSAPLIHNKYPAFAEEIRQLVGKSTRQQRDNKHESLLVERQKNRELRAQLNRLTGEIIDLASENESLRRKLAMQQAIAEGKVALIRPRKTP